MERHQCGEYATEHLNAKLTEGRENFLVALRDVAKAYGGMRQLSTESNLPRESVYRMLSKNGNPSFSSLDAILSALGLRLTVTLKEPKN